MMHRSRDGHVAMASQPTTLEPALEAVHKHFEESSGLEVDPRGLELATPPPPAPLEKLSFWKRYRAWILGLVVICLVAGIVGGAVGGTREKHDGAPNPTATSSVASSQPSATMSGAALPQTGYYAYPTPISSLGQESIDVYMLGFDQALYYKQYANSTWQPSSSAFSDLYGSINANTAAVSRSIGSTDLFARAGDYSLLHKWRSYNQSPWSPSLQSWQSQGFWSGSSPELVSWSSDRLDAFIIGGDSLIYTMTWQESTGNWSSWHWLGANENSKWLNYTPTVVSWASGRYDLFAVNSANNTLHHRYLTADSSWQPQASYEKLGGYCTSRPVVISPVTGRLDVFVRGGDAGLWHIAYGGDSNTAMWSNFSSLGNLSITGEPHAVSWSANRIDVFAWGAQDRAVWHISSSSVGIYTAWDPWESLGGDSSSPPKAVSKAPGQLDVFVVGRQGNLMRRGWDEERGTWDPGEGWEDLGAP